jgi:putative RNA 2'-phosphotransferase
METNLVKISKLLSFVLRHRPDKIGLSLDKNGWADVQDLIDKINSHNGHDYLTVEILEEVVRKDNKKRYAFNDDKTKIRASQGHSVDIDLKLKETTPPEFLYHGTATQFIENIKKQGLKKMRRNHVHLSLDVATAKIVGERHGKPIILRIKSKEMNDKGVKFYLSDNKVWLTDDINTKFIDFEWQNT